MGPPTVGTEEPRGAGAGADATVTGAAAGATAGVGTDDGGGTTDDAGGDITAVLVAGGVGVAGVSGAVELAVKGALLAGLPGVAGAETARSTPRGGGRGGCRDG